MIISKKSTPGKTLTPGEEAAEDFRQTIIAAAEKLQRGEIIATHELIALAASALRQIGGASK